MVEVIVDIKESHHHHKQQNQTQSQPIACYSLNNALEKTALQSGETTTMRCIAVRKIIASIGIMGPNLRPMTSQHYHIEVFKVAGHSNGPRLYR